MGEVVRLKAGDQLPGDGEFLVITRVGRIRAFEYFIDVSPALSPKIGKRVPEGGPGYPSAETALREAQALADRHDVGTIFLQDDTVFVRPFFPGTKLA